LTKNLFDDTREYSGEPLPLSKVLPSANTMSDEEKEAKRIAETNKFLDPQPEYSGKPLPLPKPDTRTPEQKDKERRAFFDKWCGV
jgi:hypothetical protein